MSLEIMVGEKSPGIMNVALKGTLDANTYQTLEKRMELVYRTTPEVIIFDLEHLDYISSMGLRCISKARKIMKDTNGSVVLVNLQPQIQEVFDIIKALPAEQIFRNIEEMDTYLLARQKMNIAERKKQ